MATVAGERQKIYKSEKDKRKRLEKKETMENLWRWRRNPDEGKDANKNKKEIEKKREKFKEKSTI